MRDIIFILIRGTDVNVNTCLGLLSCVDWLAFFHDAYAVDKIELTNVDGGL